jgi:hypothetical protein
MSETVSRDEALGDASPEEITSAVFAGMVMQQTQMALMFLGKIAHPEKGEPVTDLDGARVFIDQLEMLEAKTKGNLDQHEAALLKQSLMTVRMAFVEAVEKPRAAGATTPTAAPVSESKTTESGESKPAEPAGNTAEQQPPPPADDESRKKFTKKY